MPKENTPPCARMPSYMTAFQSSPVKERIIFTWNTVNKLLRNVSKFERGLSSVLLIVTLSKRTQRNTDTPSGGIISLPVKTISEEAFKNLEIHLAKRADRDVLSPRRRNDDLLGTPDTKRKGRITRNARKALTSTPCINVDRDELNPQRISVSTLSTSFALERGLPMKCCKAAAAPAPAPPPATVPLTVSGMFGVSPPLENTKKLN
uniref:Uncharacterized protein n=1 Tax=Glossina austeni TaxID=7395 RepID=A0A1A9VGV4_GLOAU